MHSVIDSREEYLRATDAIAAGTGPIAVDAERASGFKYSQRAYLIQVFRREAGTFLFDPPAIGRFDELNSALADDEWILHAASQDLGCLREVGLDPSHVFDTELAGRLLGMPRVGLGAVVEELLGVHLAKEHSAADWSTRPLPESWLVYAALDVELLVDLRDVMADMLTRSRKSTIAAQEFDAVRTVGPKAPRKDPWRKLSGVHSIRGARQLAIARELWQSRDALAQELDIAPGRLVPDASLVAITRTPPTSKAQLMAMKDFRGRASRTEIDRWWTAVETALQASDLPDPKPPRDTIPPPRSWKDRRPQAHDRLTAAQQIVQAAAEELDLPAENLLKPALIRHLAWAPPHDISTETVGNELASLGARPWQIVATSQLIADAFVEANQLDSRTSEHRSQKQPNDS